MSRILVTTLGSLGDLYPFLAIGLELKRRGHDVVIGTNQSHQKRVVAHNLEFHRIRPDCDWLSDPEKVKRLSHTRLGLIRVGREWLMPAIRETYEDTLHASEGADMLITMVANYATRLVAEKQSIPWVSAIHIPMGFFSITDPPILDFAPTLSKSFKFLGRPFWGPVFWCGKRASRFLARPWYELRAELGLPPTREGNPLSDSHSPYLVLALFSELFTSQKTGFPSQTVLTGTPFMHRSKNVGLSQELLEFLNDGPPPIVFTLGSAVSTNKKLFYENSLAASHQLNRRAVLVIGGKNRLTISKSEDAIVVEYAPFEELFPRAVAVVQHGGIGTTSLGMRHGCPMLIVPQAWDQFDNAQRAVNLGVARSLLNRNYTPNRVISELKNLLTSTLYSQRCQAVANGMKSEAGVDVACEAIERILNP